MQEFWISYGKPTKKKFAEFLINTMFLNALESLGCKDRVQEDPGGKYYLISWINKREHQVTHGDLCHGICIYVD